MLRTQFDVIAVRPANVECPYALALKTAFPHPRWDLDLQLLVCRRDSVRVAKALAMWRLTPKNSRAACDVLVLVDIRWVDEGEAATARWKFIVSNANDRATVSACVDRQGFRRANFFQEPAECSARSRISKELYQIQEIVSASVRHAVEIFIE